MLWPITRPCLLAWVPRGTWWYWPETRLRTSTQSPPAHSWSWPRTPHLHVGADAAVVAQRQPGLVGQGRVGPDPEAEDDRVGGHGPVAGLDRPDLAVAVGVEAGDGGVGMDVDAQLLHRLVHQLAHVRIERAHGLGGLVDHGHRHLPAGQGLGHLHPDVAAADHHGP